MKKTIRTREPLTDSTEPQQWHSLWGPQLLQAPSPLQKINCQLLYSKAFPFELVAHLLKSTPLSIGRPLA